jgi:rod shape-determining protein MreC
VARRPPLLDRDTHGRRLLTALIVACVILISIDNGESGVVNSMRTVVHNVLAPVQSIVSSSFQPLRDVAGGVVSSGSLRHQNSQLRHEIAGLRRQLRGQGANTSNIGQLERLLDLPTAEDLPSISAQVTAGAPNNFERTVQLDRGSSSGIKIGYPVVTGDGLVGRVATVTSHDATVTLLDNPSVAVGVRLEVSQVFAQTVATAGHRDLDLGALSDPTASVSKGELVFTSAAIGSPFPPDEPVGVVTRYTADPHTLSPTITVAPLVNLNRLDYVRVLRWPGPSAGSRGG